MEEKYTTGKFAKKANVTERTIRYYDKVGLLKPSYIGENGYRYYTQQDLVKLQQILSLKYIGFSLDEIFMMTHLQHHLKDSLQMQLNLIEQKQRQLQTIHEALDTLIAKPNVALDEITQLIHMTQLENEIIDQYKTSNNIYIRILLHEKYSQAKEPWFSWLYKQMKLPFEANILELGCGNGKLWLEHEADLSLYKHLILTDKSEGMISDIQKNLQSYTNLQYGIVDAMSLPYQDESVDIIICNHVLFYVSDLNQCLAEVRRVLKPGGIFYCTTYGKKHMKEITDLCKEYNPKITLSSIALYEHFGLDDGEKLLATYFDEVNKVIHPDYLLVDCADDLINYILSCHGNQNEYITKNYDQFKKFIDLKFSKKPLRITKDAGLFIAKKKL